MKKIKLSAIILLLIVLAFNIIIGACKSNNDTDDDPGQITQPDEDLTNKHYVIKDGRTNYCIVIPEKSSVSMTYAKNQLSDYLYQVTGVKLNAYYDNQELPQNYNYISLGKTKYLAQEDFGFDYKLNGDGFYIYTSGDNIYIEAGVERGILYGVYEFLERFAGIKFVAEDYYYIPSKSEVFVGDLRIKEVPDFKERDAFCAITSGSEFFSKMRLIDPYGYSSEKYGENYKTLWNSMGHTVISKYLPKTEYRDQHPDWYSDSGNQVNPTSGLDDNDNYTGDTESGIYAMIQAVKREIINNPTQKYFFLGQEDHEGYQCEGFTKSYERNGRSTTAVWMIYINTIAKEIDRWVKETYPEREIYIGTFAYQWTLIPPVKEEGGNIVPINDKVVAPDNVFVMIAPISACYYHDYLDPTCKTNEIIAKYLEGWSKISNSFIVWDYQCNFKHYLNWFPHYNSMKENYKTYLKYGFWRIQQQNSTGEMAYYQDKLDVYVTSKLMWNTDRNVEDLIKEFNYYYFGEAAEYVDAFVDLLNTRYTIAHNGQACLGVYDVSNAPSTSYQTYPLSVLSKALGYIRQGMEKIQNSTKLTAEEKEIYTDHLARVIVQPMYMILMNFNNYYDPDLKYDFAREFCYWGDRIGLRYVYEGGLWTDYKASLGF